MCTAALAASSVCDGRLMRRVAHARLLAGAAAAGPTTPQELTLDAGAPTTTLQVRLADGSRKIVKANHTHTVLQLKQHISTFSPGLAFTLKSGARTWFEDLRYLASSAFLLHKFIIFSLPTSRCVEIMHRVPS